MTGTHKLNDVQLNALIKQTRNNVVLIISEFPKVYIQCGINFGAKLWQSCFYTKLSKLRQIYELAISKQSKQLKGIRSFYLTSLSNSIDFYKNFVEMLRSKLNALNTALIENRPVEELFNKNLYSSLIYLGDLARYLESVRKENQSFRLSESYYLQAIESFPEQGNAFNQVAKLSISKNKLIVAAGFYIRALRCEFPFEPAKTNLRTLCEVYVMKNEKRQSLGSTLSSVDDMCFVILFTLVTLLKAIKEDVSLTESATDLFSIAFAKLCDTKYVSKRVLYSVFILVVEVFETYKKNKQNLLPAVFILEIMTRTSFVKVKEAVKSGSTAVLSPLLVFLSLVTDYFSLHSDILGYFSEQCWDCQALEDLAKEAPLTALTAREPLKEEMEFSGFVPLKEVFAKFCARSNSCIREKIANPYRAKKIVSFVLETVFVQDCYPSSVVDREENFSEEILIGKVDEEVKCFQEKTSAIFTEGLVTGYNDEDEYIFDQSPTSNRL